MNDDRTKRWLVLIRHNHKDGGHFWSGSGFADGSYPAEALDAYLAENPYVREEKYAVLDWQAARVFTGTVSVTEDD
jgi:hypothetical protein